MYVSTGRWKECSGIKANFAVLEGLLTVLLEEPIHILEILESEGNQQSEDDKFNRVDIKAKDSKDEIIIVESRIQENCIIWKGFSMA